ncbi:MAG: helix-turn-helix domain-containing protein [Archangiaceae bacterium]|nr:helix-turn-helix domain-containing protein [Archangiaceae bacterium]
MPRHREKHERHEERDRLRRLRDTLGFSQRELASEFNVSAGALAQWETGERTIPGPILRLLELYEGEVTEGRSQPRAWAVRTGWLERQSETAIATALWLGMKPLLRASEHSVAGRTRSALMRRYVQSVGKLKGLSMKLGQMLSYMDFAVPAADAEVLRALQTQSEPMPPFAVTRVFVEELGAPPASFFQSWSARPISAASLGQVHRATLPSGEDVAVKVQYPRMAEALAADLRSVRSLDSLWSMLVRGQQPGVFFAELAARFQEECNYVHEARWQKRFRELYERHPVIQVPREVPRLSTPRILTSAFVEGATLHDFVRDASEADRRRASLAITELYWGTVLRTGWLNTDPHPGNLIFPPGKVAFVDFGRVQELSLPFVRKWKQIMRATLERKADTLLELCLQLGTIPHPERFVGPYLYTYMVGFYRPWLTPTFRFTPDYLRRLWRVWVTENPNLLNAHYTAEMAFFSQLTFGVGSVLARLNVEVDYRTQFLDWLYEPGEPRPAPFTVDELHAMGFA